MQEALINVAQLEGKFAQNKSWDAQYRVLIQLGKQLPEMAESDKNAKNEVLGCASPAWLKVELEHNHYHLTMHSETRIVKGLMMILLIVYQHKSATEIEHIEINAIFERLGLLNHLSPSRTNGLFAIVKRITQLGLDENDQ
ncbi:Fe-S metabolism associated SufE [Psychromonas sp. CNPT3]|uniref:SufE family protein n=1 Tax=Psychromonas sp. CNPT3 TaxID=314282 RepID=UPI00006E78A8|nr:SufE family protein [Psychromonas sp. CNPT3]AGH82095.1 Fe-S metabolism associated SufE [Psychromonas sp. CNPT3]